MIEDLNKLERYKLLLLLAEVKMREKDICDAIATIDEKEPQPTYIEIIK